MKSAQAARSQTLDNRVSMKMKLVGVLGLGFSITGVPLNTQITETLLTAKPHFLQTLDPKPNPSP